MRYAVIMAGGAGTRLWPAARRHAPKQLQPLIFEQPLIAETVDRSGAALPAGTHLRGDGGALCRADPPGAARPAGGEHYLRAGGKNTAAAITLAALRIAHEDPEGIFAVFPADHVILKPEDCLPPSTLPASWRRVHRVVDIGVPPDHPETGYGYIEMGEELEDARAS